MPEISRFLGIIITMYFDEHNPPHFHVRYNEFRAKMHREELMKIWETREFHKVEPLV
jgi:hypothetical protein